MRIRFLMEGEAAENLRRRSGADLSRARREMVREGMKDLLNTTTRNTPVDTAQTRAAWVSALEQLGGTAPPGWEGPSPSGVAAGRQLGRAKQEDEENRSMAAATNGVHYVRYLEYGTSRMAPFAMVRRAMVQVRGRIKSWFHL